MDWWTQPVELGNFLQMFFMQNPIIEDLKMLQLLQQRNYEIPMLLFPKREDKIRISILVRIDIHFDWKAYL